jgi:fatty-acyl-CoA synthase
VLCAPDGVAATAIIGVPDEKWGELVMAYVQVRPGAAPSAETLTAAVRAAKGALAAPKRVEFVDVLPQTALGKIDRKALRARHRQQGARAVR